eukprot:COSAG01_NODE_608_length_14865_cov_5.517879_5_plen_175_part_00
MPSRGETAEPAVPHTGSLNFAGHGTPGRQGRSGEALCYPVPRVWRSPTLCRAAARCGGPSCALLDFSRMVLLHARTQDPAGPRMCDRRVSSRAFDRSMGRWGVCGCMPRLFAAEVSRSVVPVSRFTTAVGVILVLQPYVTCQFQSVLGHRIGGITCSHVECMQRPCAHRSPHKT